MRYVHPHISHDGLRLSDQLSTSEGSRHAPPLSLDPPAGGIYPRIKSRIGAWRTMANLTRTASTWRVIVSE